MGGNAVKCQPVTFEDGQKTIEWFNNYMAPILKGNGGFIEDFEVVGSFGKKKEGNLYGDIDIAVLVDSIPNSVPLDILALRVEEAGFECVKNYGFSIVSFAAPSGDGFAQIDLMLSPNLEWARFIDHSPDFRKDESKYKTNIRNIFLMCIITETQKDILKTTPEGIVTEIDVNIIRYPTGVWRVRKSFMGKKGPVKTGKNLPGYEKFITNDPQEFINMTLGKDFCPSDANTFEQIWEIVSSDSFIWINKREEIINRYIECLNEQGFPIPEEIVKYKK